MLLTRFARSDLGYFPTRIREKGGAKSRGAAGSKKKKGTGFSIGKVSNKQITQITRQLSTLQDAGLPILRSLNILEDQQKPGLLKNVLRGPRTTWPPYAKSWPA